MVVKSFRLVYRAIVTNRLVLVAVLSITPVISVDVSARLQDCRKTVINQAYPSADMQRFLAISRERDWIANSGNTADMDSFA